jgi:DNA-binding NarL/FixJ family response regulator
VKGREFRTQEAAAARYGLSYGGSSWLQRFTSRVPTAFRSACSLTVQGWNMNIVVLTPVRLFGDGLNACFSGRPDMCVVAVLSDLASLRETLRTVPAHVVLVDVTLGIDLFDVRAIAAEWPNVALVALGLNEQRQDVIQCGRVGFAGYIARHASIDAVCKSLWEIVDGRLACPPEISGGLLRALFRKIRGLMTWKSIWR